jgi:Rieske Fe-S protein
MLSLDAIAGAVAARAEPADERPKVGDLLVSADSDSPTPLEPKDIPAGGPQLLAWPKDAASVVVRKGSRLNKVLLLRFDPATLTAPTSERAAEGVVAYSAICPHAGCEVSVWDGERKILECSCHYSHYDPRAGAAVIDGPAPRALAALPLKILDGKLAVAKPFTSRVGIIPT